MPELIETNKRHPAKLVERCQKSLEKLEAGQVRCKRIVHHKLPGTLYKIDVGMCYRLLSRDRVNWWIASHETYNNLLKGH